jgi:hypothetical protein
MTRLAVAMLCLCCAVGRAQPLELATPEPSPRDGARHLELVLYPVTAQVNGVFTQHFGTRRLLLP